MLFFLRMGEMEVLLRDTALEAVHHTALRHSVTYLSGDLKYCQDVMPLEVYPDLPRHDTEFCIAFNTDLTLGAVIASSRQGGCSSSTL